MCDGILLSIGEDGLARAYDDTYDITIHCETEEERDKALEKLESMERGTGKWLEKGIIHKNEADTVIEEWQSAKCSACGKYHTTPYMYYFNDFSYCPNCGADLT